MLVGPTTRLLVQRAYELAALCAWLLLLATTALADSAGERRLSDAPVSRSIAQSQPEGSAHNTPIKQVVVADIPIWKRITLGTHKGVGAMRAALEAAKVRIGDSADEILGRPAFPYGTTKTELDLVVLAVADLGFAERWASLGDIHNRAAQLGLELCPAEAGPQLRLAYRDQPLGEFLQIAMRPIATYAGALTTLTLANAGTGLLLLGGRGDPDLMLHTSAKFVFVHPQQIAQPNVR